MRSLEFPFIECDNLRVDGPVVQRLEPLLAPEGPPTGRPIHPHHTILNSIQWILRTGAPWRDLRERYGPTGTLSSRFFG